MRKYIPEFPIIEILIIVAVIMISLGFGSLMSDYKQSDIEQMNRLQNVDIPMLTPDEKVELGRELKKFIPADK